jgi:hypothetical protein
MADMKPCPFCGSGNQTMLGPTCQRHDEYDPNTRAFPIIRCGGCFTDVPGTDWDNSGNSAVAAWNRRAAEAELAGELRRMVDHFSAWANDHADEATCETWAALHCARDVLSKAGA